MMVINILCLLAVVFAVISWVVLVHDIETTERRKKRDINERNNKTK